MIAIVSVPEPNKPGRPSISVEAQEAAMKGTS